MVAPELVTKNLPTLLIQLYKHIIELFIIKTQYLIYLLEKWDFGTQPMKCGILIRIIQNIEYAIAVERINHVQIR